MMTGVAGTAIGTVATTAAAIVPAGVAAASGTTIGTAGAAAAMNGGAAEPSLPPLLSGPGMPDRCPSGASDVSPHAGRGQSRLTRVRNQSSATSTARFLAMAASAVAGPAPSGAYQVPIAWSNITDPPTAST